MLSLGCDLAAPRATRAGKQKCSRVTVPSPTAEAAGHARGVKGTQGKNLSRHNFTVAKSWDLTPKYGVHSLRWEVGRLPRGKPQYFERQQIVSYKLKNQNARSKLEARIFFFSCFLFFSFSTMGKEAQDC